MGAGLAGHAADLLRRLGRGERARLRHGDAAATLMEPGRAGTAGDRVPAATLAALDCRGLVEPERAGDGATTYRISERGREALGG
jgi:hypothetical protein